MNKFYIAANLHLLSSKKSILNIFLTGVFILLGFYGQAQVSLTNAGNTAFIDFSNTMPTTVGSNPTTAYAGQGFAPNTAFAGRLNSNAWSSLGWSDPDVLFGGTGTGTDHGRGSTAVAVPSTGGIYAYTGAPQSVANPCMLFQPGGTDFTPGSLTLRLQNNGTTPINRLEVSYKLFVRNDQNRSNSFNFSYSYDNISYTAFSPFDYTSPLTADAFGWVSAATMNGTVNPLTSLNIPATTMFYLRWTGSDVSGSGARDEFGLDDINIVANYPGACTPPTTNASLTGFANTSGGQFDVNFTRGNGTGGVMIVASPIALSATPINGIAYTANSNYGSGAAIGNGFVAYNSNAVLPAPGGTGSFTLTGLTAGTNYVLTAFEYNVTGPCYTATGVSNNNTTSGSFVTQVTDAFRSRASTAWSNVSTWQSFTGGSWINADRFPTSAAAGIEIQGIHTVTIANTVSMDEVTVNGNLVLLTGGKINLTDGTGFDMNIQSGGFLKIQSTALYANSFNITAGATFNVASGGTITIGNGGSSPGYSPLGYLPGLVTWNDNSFLEWNSTDPFVTNGVTYFATQTAASIPVFKVIKSPSLIPGANSPTVWNGRVEISANLTLRLAGTKTFRDGLICNANLNQDDDCGQFIFSGSAAVLGKTGTGTLTLNNLSTVGGAVVATGATVSLLSDMVINQVNNATFQVATGATFNMDASTITGTTIFTSLGTATLRMGSPGGISTSGLTGNVQSSGARTFSNTGNYIYNGTTNQVTGNGLPTAMTSLTITNTGLALNNTVSLTTTNTTTPTLNLNNGLFAIGSGQQLNISNNGNVNASLGDFAVGATGGILNFQGLGFFNGTCNPYNVYASGGVDFGASPITVTIQTGGSFRINSGGYAANANSHAPFYATGSTLVYNNGANFNNGIEWIAGTTLPARGGPGNVTLLASGTSLNFGGVTQPHYMTGDLLLSSGTIFTQSTYIANGSQSAGLHIGGNWTMANSASYVPNSKITVFNSTTSNQTVTVTGGGTINFPYLSILKSGTFPNFTMAAAPNATNILVSGSSNATIENVALNVLTLTEANIELNGNTFTFYGYNANQHNIIIDGNTATGGTLTRNITSSTGQGYFKIDNPTSTNSTVLMSRSSTAANKRAELVFGINVEVSLSRSGTGLCGINFGSAIGPVDMCTINGSLKLNNGSFVTTTAPTYGTGSKLIYNTNGAYSRSDEWNAVSGPGYPYDVSIIGTNTILTLNTATSVDRAMAGSLFIDVTDGLILNSAMLPQKLTIYGNLYTNGSITLPPTLSSFGADIWLAGDWTRSSTGTFIPNERAVFFIGTGDSRVYGDGGETFPYLYLTKSSNSQSVFLDEKISITKILGIGTGILNLLNKDVILKSDITATASVNKITGAISYGGGAGTGRFLVERYIPTNVGGSPYHGKTWQFLAVPVNTDNQTVKAAWQEGQAPLVVGTAGLGTIITNNVTGTGGFDIVAGVGPSMKSYDPVTDSWIGITGTNVTHYDMRGYMILVRGDRNASAYNSPATITTLRTRGKLMEPANPAPTTNVGNVQFAAIGNPYASTIDFSNDIGVVKSINIQRVFYVWDPRLGSVLGLGAYQTLTKNVSDANYTISPGGGSYGAGGSIMNNIQSGQAFFVHTVGGTGSVAFNENAKVAGSSLVTRTYPVQATEIKQIRNNLYKISGTEKFLVDGVLDEMDKTLSTGIDDMDALKIINGSENLGIKRFGQLMSVERRGDIKASDTIQYNLSQLGAGAYSFEIVPRGMESEGLKAYLEDRYLRTFTPVNLRDTNWVNFSIENQAGSYAADRFLLVFVHKGRSILITKLDGIKNDQGNLVNWQATVANEKGTYIVERSADGEQFTAVHTEPGTTVLSYNWVDDSPLAGVNYYRIRNTTAAGDITYSNLIKIQPELTSDQVAVYPNPVKNKQLGLQLNTGIKGSYALRLYNNSGQVVYKTQLQYTGTAGIRQVSLPAAIASGIYQLEIILPDGSSKKLPVMVD